MHSFWRRKNWAKPRAGPKASGRRARERLTKSGKVGRNIIPLCGIMDRRFPEWRCSPARVSSRLLPSSTCALHGRARPGLGQGSWPHGTRCPRAISNRCCRPWCGWASCKGIRGPRGGYELARERRRITADDILRAAGTIEDASDRAATAGSTLLNDGGDSGGRAGGAGVLGRAQPHQSRRTGAQGRARLRGRHGSEFQRSEPATPRRHRPRSRSGLFRRDSACA